MQFRRQCHFKCCLFLSRNFSLTMELPLAAATCNRNKRQNVSPLAHEDAKRLKTVQGGDDMPEGGHWSRPPRISVPLDRLQQPITLNELTELLHYATLGKSGGIKQPR